MTNILEGNNSSKIIEALSGCLWCKNGGECGSKGNRNHAFLSCEHKDLKGFRTKITNLIESKFRIFFINLLKATDSKNVETCLKDTETTFLKMQSQNLGRLRHMDRSINIRYIPLADILHREGRECIHDALKNSKENICCEIFGLLPNSNGPIMHDDQIGLVDCPWLGLIPISIDKIMVHHCNKIRHFILHKESALPIVSDLIFSWNEIKNLIMGRAIGAHRVICSTGKRIEKAWRKEFNIDKNSIRKLKLETDNIKSEFTDNLIFSKVNKKRSYETCRGVAVKREVKRLRSTLGTHTPIGSTKTCNGITCNHKHKIWAPHSSFSPNSIKSSSKQCQRCSRYMTALRKSKHILENISEGNKIDGIISFIKFIHLNHNNMQYKYSTFITKIKDILSSTSTITLEEKSRNKVSDSLKLTCNILCTSIQTATNNFILNNHTCIQSSISFINKTLLCKESDFTLDRVAENKIKLLTSNNNNAKKEDSCNEMAITPTKNKNTKVLDDKQAAFPLSKLNLKTPIQNYQRAEEQNGTSNTNSFHQRTPTKKCKGEIVPVPLRTDVSDVKLVPPAPLKEFAAKIIRPSRYMLGIEMTMAIEVIRSFRTRDLYIASAEASNQIASWRVNQDWTSFAKIFGSRALIENKLNGTYLIPMFSGETNSGHWFLCVVQKIGQRKMRAWCVDSLGRGNIRADIKLKIETAFAPGRAKLSWEHCHCRCQEELECGPRTVLAMSIIQQNLANGVPTEECIQIATLNHAPYHSFSPSRIREKIAFLVNTFVPSMITPPIRLKRRHARKRNSNTTKKSRSRPDQSCVIID